MQDEFNLDKDLVLLFFSEKNGDNKFILVDRQNDYPDISNFLSEIELESDRGIAIVTAALLDEILFEIILAYVQNPETLSSKGSGNGFLATFQAKLDLCAALGLMDEKEVRNIKIVQKIRNKFAHLTNQSFEREDIADQCRSLNYAEFSEGFEPKKPKDLFLAHSLNLLIEIYDRPKFLNETILPEFGIKRVLKSGSLSKKNA